MARSLTSIGAWESIVTFIDDLSRPQDVAESLSKGRSTPVGSPLLDQTKVLRRSVIDAVERMFSIPYTGKKYIYFRHFSAPSLDSLPIVCYKPYRVQGSVGKVYEGRLL